MAACPERRDSFVWSDSILDLLVKVAVRILLSGRVTGSGISGSQCSFPPNEPVLGLASILFSSLSSRLASVMESRPSRCVGGRGGGLLVTVSVSTPTGGGVGAMVGSS